MMITLETDDIIKRLDRSFRRMLIQDTKPNHCRKWEVGKHRNCATRNRTEAKNG